MNIKQSLGFFGFIGVLLFGTDAAFSATRTYEGGGGNSLWSNELNWDGNTDIGTGDTVVIGVSGDSTINNDLSAGFSLSGITFSAGVPPTTLTGNLINLSGGLENSSGNLQIINLGLNLVSPIFVPAGDAITIGGAVSGSGGFALVGGALNLNTANSYSGGTFLGSDLQLGADDALGTGGFEFAGGVLSANSISDSTIGSLTLSGDSTLSLSPGGAAGTLIFDNALKPDDPGDTLTIDGWSGLAGSGGTDDRIFITADPGTVFLSQIDFPGFGTGAIWLGTGEIVPVPEPTEWALIIFATLAALYKSVLPRFSKTVVA